MDANDFFEPNTPVVNLHATNRWQAIDELIEHLIAAHRIQPEHREAIVQAVKTREQAMSTGVGFEIGIPHASTELVSNVMAIVGRSAKGLEFQALDGKPVRLVVLVLVPAGQWQKHINTLANLAKLLHHQEFRDGLWDRFG